MRSYSTPIPVPVTKWSPLCDLTPLERSIWLDLCTAHGYDQVHQNPVSFAATVRAVEYLERAKIPGDLVECGVYQGNSEYAMIRALQAAGAQRDIWLFDTFQGMPPAEPRDRWREWAPEVDPETHRRESHGGATDTGSNWVRESLANVEAFLLSTGYPSSRLHFVEGKVEDTLPGLSMCLGLERIALLRLDTDFYASTRCELEVLYPRVAPGGVIIVDDYGAFAGAKEAVDEFTRGRVLLHRVDEHVVQWVKRAGELSR
jgi:O-methyltransferase